MSGENSGGDLRKPDAWLYENAVQLIKLLEPNASLVRRGYTETPLFYQKRPPSKD